MTESIVSLPPKVDGLPQGWLRLTCAVLDDSLRHDGDESDGEPDQVELSWWGTDPNKTQLINVDSKGCCCIEYIVRTSPVRLGEYFRDAGDYCLRLRYWRSQMQDMAPLKCQINLWEAFGDIDADMMGHMMQKRLQLEFRQPTGGNPVVSAECVICACLGITETGKVQEMKNGVVEGRPSLDSLSEATELGSSWSNDITELHVQLMSVSIDPMYAPRTFHSDLSLYATVGMAKGKGGQRTTTTIACTREECCLVASWDQDAESSLFSFKTDEQVRRSSSVDSSSSSSKMPESPIMSVGVWKSDGLNQYVDFSKPRCAQDGMTSISPFDEMIGSAVIVPTGALLYDDGVELPLYNSDLKKVGHIHVRMCKAESKQNHDESNISDEKSNNKPNLVDQETEREYEILSGMKMLVSQVVPRGPVDERRRPVSWSGSSSDGDHYMLGVAVEGAVSCSDDDIEKAEDIGRDKGCPGLVTDDWLFDIEKKCVVDDLV